MAKALLGHLPSDTRGVHRLTSENARLRLRVSELETLVLRLQQENDRLRDIETTTLMEQEMLPA
ncbi:hypothetical protein IEQ44_01750 [Nocardioides sp. Y6]|uniref:Transposase n=1 Tax=Nocardioides malaquae TaxID=2773426 RepID=A0ABR9RP98_9ACTN|nr:hypothetical protein [Nocardioides malaquae]MBE7323378.1 hypothetical protein [Nocardioides malaquae]